MPKKILLIDLLKCKGCLRCELVCSFIKENVFNITVSRIRLLRFTESEIYYPAVCEQCFTPPCKDACPVDAIKVDKQTGAIMIDKKSCIGCHQCFQACPIGRVYLSPQSKIPIICDLCGGNPLCVAECEYEAIKFINFDQANSEVSENRAKNITKILELIT